MKFMFPLVLMALSSTAFALNGDCNKEALAEAIRQSVQVQPSDVGFNGNMTFQYEINQSNADETDFAVILNGKNIALKAKDMNNCVFTNIGSKVKMVKSVTLLSGPSLSSGSVTRFSAGFDAVVIDEVNGMEKIQRGAVVGWVPEDAITIQTDADLQPGTKNIVQHSNGQAASPCGDTPYTPIKFEGKCVVCSAGGLSKLFVSGAEQQVNGYGLSNVLAKLDLMKQEGFCK